MNGDKRSKLRWANRVIGWLVGTMGCCLYLATMEPTVSFWDCGEFIATTYKFEVGHPPGAPLYQLLAHCFMFLSGGETTRIAWWSNAFSAVVGGLTGMILYWTIVRLLIHILYSHIDAKHLEKYYFRYIMPAAMVGSWCYMLCDTAWFSAVESEVYALSMLFSALIIWSALRWLQCEASHYAPRWLLLTILLVALSTGVHQLSLLTLPTLLISCILKIKKRGADDRWSEIGGVGVLMIVVGLSPYLIIPIRAAVDPPINQGKPSTYKAFKAYLSREQYEHAPLIYGRCFNSPAVGYKDGKVQYAKEMNMWFPRMWRGSEHAEEYYCDWAGRHGKEVWVNGRNYYKPSYGDNLIFFTTYQLGYMYLRYIMWNFAGRYNDQQGYGGLQNGQFATGITPIDRLYIGTSRSIPQSGNSEGHHRYFLLPLLIGIVGLVWISKRDKKVFWLTLTLFFTSSLLLSIYLNHPIYEPRERDYAYVLSFYAFAIWIGCGAYRIVAYHTNIKRRSYSTAIYGGVLLIVVGVPLLMGCQNWEDHNRSHRYTARDSALNLMNSCRKGSILFTYGDNDTYPLWYLQEVESVRTDLLIINTSLLSSHEYAESIRRQYIFQKRGMIDSAMWQVQGVRGRMAWLMSQSENPIYFSRYGYVAYCDQLPIAWHRTGMAYRTDRLTSEDRDTIDVEESYRLLTEDLRWEPTEGVYLDPVSIVFVRQYWDAIIETAENLAAKGDSERAALLILKGEDEIPNRRTKDISMRLRLLQLCHSIEKSSPSLPEKRGKKFEMISTSLHEELQQAVAEQKAYYQSVSPSLREYLQYQINPVEVVDEALARMRNGAY